MHWANRLAAVVAVFTCFAGCGGHTQYSTPGTLYVELAAAGAAPSETTEFRNGHVIGQKPLGYIVARDNPGRWLIDSDAPICSGNLGDRTYRLSPDGVHVLCSKGEDIRLFERLRPRSARVVLRNFEENANQTSFAWLDNTRFVALVLDHSCPYAHLYDFFPTRVETFDLSGRRITRGPCAFGVVAGVHRMALLGERKNSTLWKIRQAIADDPRYYNDGYDRFHHTWSLDYGKTWHDGTPLTFDGNDRLLYAGAFGEDIKSENGQTVFKNAYNVQWSR